jgi:hypothetical protein
MRHRIPGVVDKHRNGGSRHALKLAIPCDFTREALIRLKKSCIQPGSTENVRGWQQSHLRIDLRWVSVFDVVFQLFEHES